MMAWAGQNMFEAVFCTKCVEVVANELCAIVCNDILGDSVSREVCFEFLCHVFCCCLFETVNFKEIWEIINSYEVIFVVEVH